MRREYFSLSPENPGHAAIDKRRSDQNDNGKAFDSAKPGAFAYSANANEQRLYALYVPKLAFGCWQSRRFHRSIGLLLGRR